MTTSPARHREAQRIFEAATTLPSAARAEHVAAACGGDLELRALVERLLAADQDGSLALEPVLALDADALAADEDLTDRTIGRYRVLRRIGAGGMGSVWEALQDSPRRSVALKVLREGVASREALRRFEFEVEFLARLQHPGIAHVYEAGTVSLDGHVRPFFAMELVRDAKCLTEFADDRRLSTRERVELLRAVCEAVHHGHQNGVIHRDLKPGNLLVDGSGQPKVIDFGVARSTSSDVSLTTMHTHVGALIGTLAYMSPEQCEGDSRAIDVRSDVYSLGVVLYEMLCGQLPYEVAHLSIPAATRVIQEHPPLRPSARRKALRGDLEAILLKALEKDREKRYASAEALASDLRRFLAGHPIEARAPGLWSSLASWMLKHPVGFTSGVCVVIAICALASTWFTVHWLSGRPARAGVDATSRRAQLLARNGAVLHEWDSGVDGQVLLAQLVDRAPEHGGGKIVLVGCRRASSPDEPNGEVHAYALEEPTRRLWSTSQIPLVQPAGEPDRPQGAFHIMTGIVADMIAESPGLEILLLLRLRPFSASVVRIYDLTGTLRYEAWHDSAAETAVWLKGPRRVVVAGSDCQHQWEARGISSGGTGTRYPLAVFALDVCDRPPGEPRWIVRDGLRQDPSLSWYLTLGPHELAAKLKQPQAFVSSDVGSFSSETHMCVSLLLRMDPSRAAFGGLVFILDGDGREIRRHSGDPYKVWHADGLVPHESVFSWTDYELLPPVVRPLTVPGGSPLPVVPQQE